MNITAKITGIRYSPKLNNNLIEFNFKNYNEFNRNFNINDLPSYCLINYNDFMFGLSKWVSPKRTRSYPYERVYNTLGTSKRITVIPIIKDEGKDGDRDFIQWDTVSLMSLLDVFVIFAYYISAEKNKTKAHKITHQKFDNEYVKYKISEIKNYHSSALHWNLNEIKKSFEELIHKANSAYNAIGEKLNVKLHNQDGIKKFLVQFMEGVDEFMRTSRHRAQEAQNREMHTIQPKEFLSTLTKATITIENYLGGKYYFTVDEVKLDENKIYLIESKHTNNSIIPSISNIKDGLLKMILYTNLKEVNIEGEEYICLPLLKLTSNVLERDITQDNIDTVSIPYQQKEFISKLFEEAKENNFQILIKSVKRP